MEVDQWFIARLSSFGFTSVMVYVYLSNAVSQCEKREQWKSKHFLFPFTSFEMHGGRSMMYSAFVVIWPYKNNGICFSVQCRFIANKEKGDISIFLFPYLKCTEVHQWYIARVSSFGLTSIMVYVFLSNAMSLRIRKKEIFPNSFFLIRTAWR